MFVKRDSTPDYRAFAAAIAQPTRWLLTTRGLEVIVYLHEFGLCDVCTPTPPITIRWAELTGVMVANPPVP